MFSVAGYFRLVVSEGGVLVHDTGPMKNCVTRSGIDAIFWGMDPNFVVNYDEGPWSHIGLGLQTTPFNGASVNYYTLTALQEEYNPDGDGTYARKAMDADVTAAATYGTLRTDASRITWTTYWAAGFVDTGETFTCREIGVFNAATNGSLMAGTGFAAISITDAQRVDATYTVEIVQQ